MDRSILYDLHEWSLIILKLNKMNKPHALRLNLVMKRNFRLVIIWLIK